MILLHILFLPIFLIADTIKSRRSLLFKIGYVLIFLFIFNYAWFGGYVQAWGIAQGALYQYGLYDRRTKVKVSGDSMLPIIVPMESGGVEITLHSPKKYSIMRGDIVSFSNTETAGLNYIKRVVGMPGEKITLKNGYVFINDKALAEDYTLDQLPTYGNTYINDCYPQTVPGHHYLVLGDNRTVSMDSRVIGFIDQDDISGVIKTKLTYQYLSGNAQAKILKNNISVETLVQKINSARQEKNAGGLSVNNTLNEVALSRAKSIVENFADWKKTAIPLKDLLQKSNYKNNSYYEFVTFGYLDEESIVKQILDSPVDKVSFLSGNYYEIGAASEVNTVGDCSFPVITIVIGWPNRPTYSQEVINYWAGEEADSKKMILTLQDVLNYPGADKTNIREMIVTLTEMSDISANINRQITNGEWLDSQQVDRYDKLLKEIQVKMSKYSQTNSGGGGISQGQLSNPGIQPTTANTHLISGGQMKIENGVTATINSASETTDKIAIKISFANISNSNVNIFPIRVSMRNKFLGTSAENPPLSYQLDAGTVRQLDFTYSKLNGGGPYDFYYLSSSGESVKLGIFNNNNK